MAQKLFVGGLAFATTTEGLQDFFSQAGEVASAAVVMDRDTGRSLAGLRFCRDDDRRRRPARG